MAFVTFTDIRNAMFSIILEISFYRRISLMYYYRYLLTADICNVTFVAIL